MATSTIKGIETITPSITTTAGVLNEAYFVADGNTCTLRISAKNASAVANGSNVFTGIITGYRPKIGTTGGGYYLGIYVAAHIDANGVITIRNCGPASIPANNNVVVTITFIVG